MMLKELYRNFLVQLQKIYSLSEATAITDWVFEKMASLKRSDVLKNPEKTIPPAADELIQNTLQQVELSFQDFLRYPNALAKPSFQMPSR